MPHPHLPRELYLAEVQRSLIDVPFPSTVIDALLSEAMVLDSVAIGAALIRDAANSETTMTLVCVECLAERVGLFDTGDMDLGLLASRVDINWACRWAIGLDASLRRIVDEQADHFILEVV